jgi:hypothetical protein
LVCVLWVDHEVTSARGIALLRPALTTRVALDAAVQTAASHLGAEQTGGRIRSFHGSWATSKPQSAGLHVVHCDPICEGPAEAATLQR